VTIVRVNYIQVKFSLAYLELSVVIDIILTTRGYIVKVSSYDLRLVVDLIAKVKIE
jgi:hypothetical protein